MLFRSMTGNSTSTQRRRLAPSSLRTRFILGLAAMVLPPALLVAGTLFSLRSMTTEFEEVVDKVMAHELEPVAHLQTLLLRAALSLNGSSEEDRTAAALHARLNDSVDQAFQGLFANGYTLTQQRTALLSAQAQWKRAKTLREQISAGQRPSGAPSNSAPTLRRANAHIDQAVDILDGIYVLAQNESNADLARARLVKRRVTMLMGGFLAVVLVIAIQGGITLARAIFIPLLTLTRTAEHYTEGDLHHRDRKSVV